MSFIRFHAKKYLEKVKLQRHMLSNCHQKLIANNLCLDNTKYEISLKYVDQFLSYACHKIFVTHTQTDTQTYIFLNSQIVFRNPKTCKSIKKRKSKISIKPIFSSIIIEESKKCSTYEEIFEEEEVPPMKIILSYSQRFL